MTESQSKDSLSDSVYERMLEFLLHQGPLSHQLSVAQIAGELAVSRTPVTIALARLQQDGLVENTPESGWRTVQLTLEDLDELFEIKEVLDKLTVTKATENITDKEASCLMELVDEMEEAAESKDLVSWLDADGRFHDLMLEVAGSHQLRRMQDQVRLQLARFAATDLLVSDRMAAACEEHRAIASAIVAREPQLAVEKTVENLNNVSESLERLLKDVVAPLSRPFG